MTDQEPAADNADNATNPNFTDNERRPVVNDQEPTGKQGISSDKPGVDPGGYPGPPDLPETRAETRDEATDEATDDDTASEEDDA